MRQLNGTHLWTGGYEQVCTASAPDVRDSSHRLPVMEHGVVSNHMVRRSTPPNVSQSAVEAGKTTAAAGYCWFSELYKRAPCDPIDEREIDDPALLTQHGRFYTEDHYPDPGLFATAGVLARKFHPDYLLVPPMGWIAWKKPTAGCTIPETMRLPSIV